MLACVLVVFFFFSSRRRHTRCLSDWSSDVCSSDLVARRSDRREGVRLVVPPGERPVDVPECLSLPAHLEATAPARARAPPLRRIRSEERRVGKECRSRGWPERERTKERDTDIVRRA